MSEIDKAEAFLPSDRLLRRMVIWFLALLAGSILLALVFSRSLINPLRQLAGSAQELAAGRLDNPISAPHEDEIGDLANSFESMRLSIKDLVDRQTSMIDALSTPLIPLGKEILVLPLVGQFDDRRVAQFSETLANGIHQNGARAVIVDITGVPDYDEVFAKGLARAAASTRLLGAEMVITGTRPEMAKGLSALDDLLRTVIAQRSLREGIDYAMSKTKPAGTRKQEILQ